jgi:DNA-binding IscR family transcriptional regulator
LAKPAEDLTVGEVLRILEGSLAPTDCVLDDISGCGDSDCNGCVTRPVWNALFENINQVVDSITIADLLKQTYISL